MSIENIMPQEDTGGMQEYTGQPTYDGQNNITNANVIFSRLINVKKIKNPREQNSYMSGFRPALKDNGNYNNRGYEKRYGFKRCYKKKNINDGGSLDNSVDDLLNIGGAVTDIEVIDGERYFIKRVRNHDNDKERLIIVKQCSGYQNINCAKHLLPCCAGNKKILQFYPENGSSCIETNKCIYPKFQKTYGPKGPRVPQGNGVGVSEGILRAYRIGNTIVHMLYNRDGTPINYSQGNYLYAYDQEGNAIGGWYRSIKGDIMHQGKQGVQLNGFVPGLVADLNGINDGDYIEQSYVKYAIYTQLGDTLSFASNRGIQQIHHMPCENDSPSVEAGFTDMTLYGVTSNPNDQKDVTSMFQYGDALGYIAGNILYIGEGGQNPGIFTNTINLSGKYTDVVTQGNLGYLLGPNNFGILYKITYQNGTYEYRVTESEDGRGYFNPGSYHYFRGSFYQVVKNNDGSAELMTVFLNQQYDLGLGSYNYSVGYKTLSNGFIQDIFASANIFQGDEIYLSNEENELIITITDNEEQSLAGAYANPDYYDCFDCIADGKTNRFTTMLRYDSLNGDWVTWYICGMDIKKYKHGCYFGEGIYSYGGDTDDGCPIRQVMGLQFGQLNPHKNKLVDSIVLTIGGDSIIGSDTYINYTIEGSNYALHKKEKGFYQTEYVSNINTQRHMRLGSHFDFDYTRQVFDNMSFGYTLLGGYGFFTKVVKPTTRLLQRAFCCYDGTVEQECISPCPDDINTTCCDKETVNPKENNPKDNEDHHAITLSKHGNIGLKVNQIGEIFYIEIVADGTDNVQLYLYNILWKYVNGIHPKAENWLGNEIKDC